MAKSKKLKGKKYYVASQMLDSSDIFDYVKEICYKERATYRREAPTASLQSGDLEGAQEKTTNTRKLIEIADNGDLSVVDAEFTKWDTEDWRYYFIPDSLDDLEKTLRKLLLEGGMNCFDPESITDEEEFWMESKIGLPLPEEKSVIIQLMDAFLTPSIDFEQIEEEAEEGKEEWEAEE